MVLLKKYNSWTVLLIMVLFTVLFSCEKEKIDFDENTENLKSIDVPNATNSSDKIKMQLGKWFAHTCNQDEDFKRFLFESIVNIETGESNELFILDFINRKYNGATVKDAVINANEIRDEKLQELIYEMKNNLYNLVLDVPSYISWFFNPQNHKYGLNEKLTSYPYVFYPDIKLKNSNNNWTGFGQYEESHKDFSRSEGLVLHEVEARGGYNEIIPFFVKSSELNFLLNTNNSRSIDKDLLIKRYYGDVIESGEDCIKSKIDDVKENIKLDGVIYEVVNLMKLRQKTVECTTSLPPMLTVEICDNGIDDDGDGEIDEDDCVEVPEICGNGIDDDGDGEVDEDDCLPQVETNCSNGTDDDNDGLVDLDDPDCDCNCLRDCRLDNNFLIKHTFDDVDNYWTVTSENIPGVEKLIDLRYDITRLNSPPNHKIVISRATLLACEGYTNGLSVSQINTLCGYNDYDDINGKGFFYGFLIDNDAWNSNPDVVTFGVIDGINAVLLGPNNWVIEKMYYLPGAGDGNISDWDASVYGDLIRVNISEIDGDQIGGGQNQTYTFTTQLQSTQGTKVEYENDNTTTTYENKYVFTNADQSTVTNTFSIQAAHLVQLGDIDLIYCDDNDGTRDGGLLNGYELSTFEYNVINEQNGVLGWWDIINPDPQ